MKLEIYLRAFFDLLLPRTCEVCGRRLSVHEDNLCVYCRADLPLTFNWSSTHNTMADKFNAMIQRDLEREDPFGTDTVEQSGAGAADPIEQSGVGAGGSIEQSGVGAGGGPVDDAPEDAVSGREPYAFATALFFYRSGSRYREITKSLKYRGNIALGKEMAAMLGRRIASAPHFGDVDVVMPVPLHWTRRWSRGYNQAEVIAREIARSLADSRSDSCADGGPGIFSAGSTPVRLDCRTPVRLDCGTPVCLDCGIPVRLDCGIPVRLDCQIPVRLDCRTLVRVRRTRTQTHLAGEEKVRNVSSAFSVRGHPCDSGRRPPFAGGGGPILSGISGRGEDAGHSGVSGWEESAGYPGVSGWEESAGHSGVSGWGGNDGPRHILIVDDVFTTGATVNECRKVLRARFGPSVRISIATLAFVGD